MNTTNWRELYEDKDKDGSKVLDVAFWSDGTPASYRYRRASDCGGITIACYMLIPRKPAPVVVPWELDEVPVGEVVRHVKTGTKHVITGHDDSAISIGAVGYVSPDTLRELFVLHQPGVVTERCQPCGKVVGE